MTLLFVLLGAGVLLELVLHIRFVWPARRILAGASLLATAFAMGGIVMWQPSTGSILIAAIGLYRIFNCLRIVQGRMHEGYLKRATLRSSFVLLLLQLVAAGAWALWHALHQTSDAAWTAVVVLQVIASLVLVTSTTRRLRRTGWPAKAPSLSDDELPTLTVAIPARNETDDLQACLESLVRCDYPKLEIIVLDDCSQTRRTPEIIRSFAHAGVRFLEGQEPKDTWQAKNQAYDQLLKEANGEYVLFCGVDVRFEPDSLRQLLAMMLHKKKAMLSLLPWRAPGAERRLAVVQAMRYFWELALPRRLFRRPPVLSTCWIAHKKTLLELGGFEAVTRAIVPEAHFARALLSGDRYSFMRASSKLGIQSTKPAKEQYDTAIRMRYPQLHRRPENVFLLTLTYGFFILAPFVLVPTGFWVSITGLAYLLGVAAVIVLIATYLLITSATRTGSWWFSLVALPVGIATDIVLLHISMWQYEFSTIEWKGRNICVPAMHVIPHLPKI